MHSEPSKAAMERAAQVLGVSTRWDTDTQAAVARYIDTVDRVAQAAITRIAEDERVEAEVILTRLMLPDEPDALTILEDELGHVAGLAAYEALTAAGYTITKDGCDEIQ